MAEVTIQAGAKFNVVTPDELDARMAQISKSWMTELARGLTWHEFGDQDLATSGGTWQLGQINRIGPAPGFVWDIRRLAVSGGALLLGTDTWSVYRGDRASGAGLVLSGLTRTQLLDKQLILKDTDQIYLTGARTGAGNDVTLSGFAIELPAQLAWQLL